MMNDDMGVDVCSSPEKSDTLPQRTATNSNYTPPTLKNHMELLQELSIQKIRWFYQDEKKWIPFHGIDSLEIEDTFRSLPGSVRAPICIPSNEDLNISNPLLAQSCPTVRGSMYQVDVVNRECRPLYWKENPVKIMRGTWFKGSNSSGSWEPIEEKYAEKIEEAHCTLVRSMGVGGDEAELNSTDTVVHQIRFGAHRVEWQDLSEVFLISETTSSKIAQKIGFSGAIPIHRGYEFEAKSKDGPRKIIHIVFLVHGMGQIYHGEDGGIVSSRKKMIDAVQQARKQFSMPENADIDGRVEFFPIEWRSALKLDEGVIETITPANLSSLRKILNETTLDIMYYTSPFYREEIIRAVREQLNDRYTEFCRRNPSFESAGGRVSIIAHSLGSVIIHDVLSMWNGALLERHAQQADELIAEGKSSSWFWNWGKGTKARSSSSDMLNAPIASPSHIDIRTDSKEAIDGECAREDLKKRLHQARLNVAKLEAQLLSAPSTSSINNDDYYALKFKVENVFNIGSPLAVFLVMRGIRARDDGVEQHILPTSVCKRTFNIYNPVDPVAYRLEPLIFDYYKDVPPVRLAYIPSASDGQTGAASQQSTASSGASWLKSWFSAKSSSPANYAVEYEHSEDATSEHFELPPTTSTEVQEEMLRGRKVLDHRIDFVLEHAMLEYVSAITSHQSYWHNVDFARFLVNVLLEEQQVSCVTPRCEVD